MTSPAYINTLIDIRENTYNLRNNSRAEICHKRTSNHDLKSFRHIGSVLWNDLPNNIKSSSSLHIFKYICHTVDTVRSVIVPAVVSLLTLCWRILLTIYPFPRTIYVCGILYVRDYIVQCILQYILFGKRN